MLKKKVSGGAAAADGASPMRCGESQGSRPPTPPASKVARRGNGGSPPSLLLSTRSLPSPFSTDAPISPASIGEQSKTPTCFGPRNGTSSSSHRDSTDTEAAGLAGVLVAGEADGGYFTNGRVPFGRRLRVQLPQPPPPPGDFPGSPIEFGVKNRDAQLALLSPVQRSPLLSAAQRTEEELTEDYTCVIARGPNPKMTHIFEDRVVESRAGAGDGDACCGCEEDALFLQRGEKAFCRSQGIYQEALFGKRTRESSDTSVELNP